MKGNLTLFVAAGSELLTNEDRTEQVNSEKGFSFLSTSGGSEMIAGSDQRFNLHKYKGHLEGLRQYGGDSRLELSPIPFASYTLEGGDPLPEGVGDVEAEEFRLNRTEAQFQLWDDVFERWDTYNIRRVEKSLERETSEFVRQ